MKERSTIPNSVIGAVAEVLGDYYYSHSRLNTLFMENGAPGDPPEGNCVNKCLSWLKRCNKDYDVQPLEVLGGVIQEFMDKEFGEWSKGEKWNSEKERIKKALGRNGLSYQTNGHVFKGGLAPTSRSLSEIFRSGDYSAIEAEFERAISTVETDPASGITAASSLIEALCKTYIHEKRLSLPNKQNIQNLWIVVRNDLGLDPRILEQADQKKILSGLSSIVDGVGSLRTHIGSAHGRGPDSKAAKVREAKLAINASHTLTLFVLDLWQSEK